MPKELTHWILAERSLAGLSNDSRLQELILKHHDIYLGGAVLPDSLLYLHRGPHAATAQALAKHFHDADGNSFEPLLRAEQHFHDGLPPTTLACLLGVITHIQADIVFHPFVYALTGTSEISRHYKLETDIDVCFLQSGEIPPIRRMADLMSPFTRTILLDTSALIFDPDNQLPRQALEHVLNLHCRFQGMYDHTFWKLLVTLLARLTGTPFSEQRNLFYPLKNPPDVIFGENAVEWRHPVSGELRRTSLEQLAKEVVQRVTELFECIEAAGSLAVGLNKRPGENLLTGLLGVCLPH
jgi:hypothetical protein